MTRFPVLVSACLAGEACRYNATSAPHPAVLELVARGLAVPVCPEVLGGLPTPRDPVELREGLAVDKSGADRTAEFREGARRALSIGRENGCASAILKARSPSCGCDRVYDGTFTGRLVAGDGIFAALLKAGGLSVRTEEDL